MGSSKALRAQARPYLRRVRRVLRSPVRLAALFALAVLVHSRHALRSAWVEPLGLGLVGGAALEAHSTGGERALRAALRRASSHRQVVVIVASATHAQLALNVVCHLRRLAVRNYLVVAADARAYAALRARGARVFLPLPAPAAAAGGAGGAAFGTPAFAALTRVKTRAVNAALAAHLDAVLCDADVAWLRDARGALGAVHADVVATSDALPGRPRNWALNSGLYLVRSNRRTRDAFSRIARYSKAIRRSEQKAFNHILCGAFKDKRAGPGRRVGGARCVLPSRHGAHAVVTAVTSPDAFPNGAHGAWNVTLAELHGRGVVAMHANYVVGVEEKVRLLQDKGLWLVGGSGDTCHTMSL